jgi:hypothetical protein
MEPTVRALLLARVDELVARMAGLLDEVRAVTEQLEPERARACRTAIILARTGVDEIPLRAHAHPLDELGR